MTSSVGSTKLLKPRRRRRVNCTRRSRWRLRAAEFRGARGRLSTEIPHDMAGRLAPRRKMSRGFWRVARRWRLAPREGLCSASSAAGLSRRKSCGDPGPGERRGAMSRDNPRLGIALMILTTMIFAAQDGISRYLAAKYNVMTVVMIRYWFFALFVVVLSAARGGGIARVARTRQPGAADLPRRAAGGGDLRDRAGLRLAGADRDPCDLRGLSAAGRGAGRAGARANTSAGGGRSPSSSG